jgi:transcriptional regulator with XRE-family HTH domain
MAGSGQRDARNIDKLIGQRVRAYRTSSGLSQAQLASGIGVTFQQLQKYEKGINRVSASRLLRIAQVLDRPITLFYDGLQAQSRLDVRDVGKQPSCATDQAFELARVFSTIRAPSVRRKAVALVQAIVDQGNGTRSG